MQSLLVRRNPAAFPPLGDGASSEGFAHPSGAQWVAIIGAAGAEPVVPSDSADLPAPATRLWVGGGGTLKIDTLDHAGVRNTITLANVPDGSPVDVVVLRVWATGTAASSIVAFF